MFLDDMDHSGIFSDMMKNNCLFYTGSSLCSIVGISPLGPSFAPFGHLLDFS